MLSQICALQKAYGKTQDELETLVEGFSWALAEYKMPQIIKAFRQYVVDNSDIPAPADIIKIIKSEAKYANINPDLISVDTLLRYRNRGIPLTPKQMAFLESRGIQLNENHAAMLEIVP